MWTQIRLLPQELSDLGQVRSESRTLSQILEEKTCVHTSGYIFDPLFIKLN